MRLFILPAAIALAACLYLPLPQAAGYLTAGLRALCGKAVSLFTQRHAKRPEDAALALCCVLVFAAAALLSLAHPIACALLAAPLFSAWAVLPACAGAKETLDAGAYESDIPAYEDIVRSTCARLATPFVHDMIAPMLLCALGIPLHLGSAPGWLLLMVSSVQPQSTPPRVFAMLVRRASAAVLRFMLRLCSCAVGKNPLRARGDTPRALLLNILGIAGDETDTHAPMAGDIAQAVFLFALITLLLTGLIVALLAALA